MNSDERSKLMAEIYMKCFQDIIYFARNFAYIQEPVKGKILFDLYPFQEKVIKIFYQYKKIIVNKSRQIGLSTLISLYAVWLMIFHENKNIVVIATKRETAKEIIDKVKLVWYNLPLFLSGRKDHKEKPLVDNSFELKLKNGSRIKAFSASPDATRGQAASLVIFDEMAFVPKCEDIYTALLPVTDRGGQMICLSTPNGTNNEFYRIWQGAEHGDNGFAQIPLKWNVHPDRDMAWRKEQDKIFGVNRARQEYDTDFLLTGNTVLDPETISFIENTYVYDPIEKRGAEKDLWIWKYPEDGRNYIALIDTSQGTDGDSHCVQIIDLATFEQVAEYKGKINYLELPQFAISLATWYNYALLVAENTGLGWNTAISIATSPYPTNKTYKKLKGNDDYNLNLEQYQNALNDPDAYEIGFSMNAKSRPLVVSNLMSALQTNSLIVRSKRVISELRTFVYLNGKPQADKGCHDDTLLPLGMGSFLRESALLLRDKQVEYSKNLMINSSIYRPQMYNQYKNFGTQSHILNVGNNMVDFSWVLK